MDKLGTQINVVVEAREKSRLLSDKRKSMYDAFIAEHTGFFADVATAASEVGEAEDQLRELTLQAYAETGNKVPEVGVGIREVTKLTYDAKEAFKWALHHEIALTLDKKSFETFAKATPLDFVTVSQEPQATIATDLQKL